MRTAFFAIVLVPVLAACGTVDFGDRLQSEGAAISSLGSRWDNGKELVDRGQALVRKGRKKIAEGEDMVEDGEDLIERGEDLQQSAEQNYKQQT